MKKIIILFLILTISLFSLELYEIDNETCVNDFTSTLKQLTIKHNKDVIQKINIEKDITEIEFINFAIYNKEEELNYYLFENLKIKSNLLRMLIDKDYYGYTIETFLTMLLENSIQYNLVIYYGDTEYKHIDSFKSYDNLEINKYDICRVSKNLENSMETFVDECLIEYFQENKNIKKHIKYKYQGNSKIMKIMLIEENIKIIDKNNNNTEKLIVKKYDINTGNLINLK
jgi:hypothetical protein